MESIKMLRDIIKVNTTNEMASEEILVNYFKNIFKPYAKKMVVVGKKRKSLIAFFGDMSSKKILLFNGHLDTAQVDTKTWKYNPFKLTIKNDLAFGRGTADMKGGLVITAQSVIEAVKSGFLKNKQVIVAFSADEECGYSEFGAKVVADYLKTHNIKPFGCIIPEPSTLNLPPQINLGHRGLIWIKARASGTKIHSGLMNVEDNAVLKMCNFITALNKMITNQPKRINLVPETSARTLHIESKNDVFNSVPDFCEANIDVRTSPLDKNTAVLNKITKLAQKHGIKIEVIKNAPSSNTKENCKLVNLLKKSFQNLGEDFTIGYASPTCDSHHFTNIGIPTINGLGASGSNIHASNEHISLQTLSTRTALFLNLMKNM